MGDFMAGAVPTPASGPSRFGKEVEEILATLPKSGPLFPYLQTVRAGDRATEFKQRCVGLGIQGVSLHSYRYALAERAKTAGYPERFAQEALGHNSKAGHRAYARKAKVELSPLSEYERQRNTLWSLHDDHANTHERRVTATRINGFNGFVNLSFSCAITRFKCCNLLQ
jgi:hypothetical protein